MRPDKNTLIINYSVTFGVIALILFFSLGNATRYYYSPEYTSHAGYATGAVSCKDCHIKPWHSFQESTCFNCHALYDPEKTIPDMLSINKDEKGKDKPGYGAMLAFHKKAAKEFNCAACHLSHALPQKAAFNSATLARDLEAGEKPSYYQTAGKKPAEIRMALWHDKAKPYAGDMWSCQACHIAPADNTHTVLKANECWSCHKDSGNWMVTVTAAGVASASASETAPASTVHAETRASVTPFPASSASAKTGGLDIKKIDDALLGKRVDANSVRPDEPTPASQPSRDLSVPPPVATPQASEASTPASNNSQLPSLQNAVYH